MMRIYIPSNISKIAKLYVLGILLFLLFRVLLFITEIDRVDKNTATADILMAYLMGLRFDVVVCSYILVLPFVLLTLFNLIGKGVKCMNNIVLVYCNVIFSLAFLVYAGDIPYFTQFFSHFIVQSFGVISMENMGFMLGMITGSQQLLLYIIPFIVASVIFFLVSRKILLKPEDVDNKQHRRFLVILQSFGLSVFCFFLILLGIRGRVEIKSPIRVGTAYFTNDLFLNQLGLNPNFTLLASYVEHKKHKQERANFIDNTIAIKELRESLGLSNDDFILDEDIYPFERIMPISDCVINGLDEPNIILVIMESMSAEKMTRNGNVHKLTPFLDSLSHKSLYFNNFYSDGMHTFEGIFSTLYGLPTIAGKNPMRMMPMMQCKGLVGELLSSGYSTTYFATHDGQFENMEGFLYLNGFQRVVEKSAYPIGEAKTNLGVPDDYMFRFSVPILNDLAKKQNPFFATYLTSSDHKPWYIPEYFSPKNDVTYYGITEYADYSLKVFLTDCAKQNWYENTIFVFVADHGAPIDVTYDISMSYFHIPFVVFSPKLQENDISCCDKIGSQVDIASTILGMLGKRYKNQTFGYNLWNENREFAVLDADDKYGVVNDEYLLIIKASGEKSMFNYKSKSKKDVLTEHQELADRMERYAKCYFQSFDYITPKMHKAQIAQHTDK
ncbi:MAG: sulfatase-like hydrolase/transferase [Ignavibacteria bacterium]|nr:sulfatase-like hydrolase/transferase [Ignavibacteria bacterium]